MIRVLAIAAHPDDIEIMMAGTMLLLRQAGCELHCMTLSDGDCGSETMGPEETGRIRTQEAMNAAATLGAVFHPGFTHDMQIFYTDEAIRRVMAVVRAVEPAIILTHSMEDYMYDHIHAAQLAVSAAFARGAPNYRAIPETPATKVETALYHALPYGLRTMLRVPVTPDCYVNIAEVLDEKCAVLGEHASQREWLRATQGYDSFVDTMCEMCRDVGRMSGVFDVAEGWQRHSHIGFGGPGFDPLGDLLASRVHRPGRG